MTGHMSRGPHAYILLVDRPNGWRTIQPDRFTSVQDYLRTEVTLPAVHVIRGTLVEMDPLCLPFDSSARSINVISLDDGGIKASVLMRELKPLESHHYQLLKPLNPEQRYELISNPKWSSILDVKIGDTVWFYQKSHAAFVAATSRLNGNYGHVSNNSAEKDVGFVRYVGPLENDAKRPGFWVGVELFLEANKGNTNGTHHGTRYFEAHDYSSVFTKVNHLYFYDEEEDIEQVRQKIGMLRASVDCLLSRRGSKRSKNTIWRQFENDRLANETSQERYLNNNSSPNGIQEQQQQLYDRASYVDKLLKNMKGSDESLKDSVSAEEDIVPPLVVNDRVVWLSDYGPEYGIVKWIGHLPDARELIAGIAFDNPVCTNDGFYNRQQYFTTKEKHGSFVPLCGLLKAEDFDDGSHPNSTASSTKLQRRNRKLVDELDLKRRSNSQQQHLADYKLRQNMNKIKNSGSGSHEGSSRAGTDDNFSPSILGSIEPEVNWSPSLNSSPPQRVRRGGSNSTDELQISPSLDSNQKSRQNDLSLLDRKDDRFGSAERKITTKRDPYASEEFIVQAEVHGVKASDLCSEEDFCSKFVKVHPDGDDELNVYEEGTLVELHLIGKDDPIYGVVKWIGYSAKSDKKMAGIELEEELLGATNGWYNGTQLFACPDQKAVFLPFTHFTPDKRFESSRLSKSFENGVNGFANGFSAKEFGDMDCPIVPGFHSPIKTDDLLLFWGRNRGIQGHQNSCYLDATLFVMFSFTSVFDCLLYRPQVVHDIPEYGEVQRVLREEIVNPLRKNWFVRADRVMKLRQLLDSLTSVRGLMSEEKDPEELLNSLLSQTLKAAPFLELSSGQSAHLYQLFVERDESKSLPTVQELFEQSFLTSGVKLKRVPSVLILQMPRFGRQFKVYDRILPSQILDVTDVIEDAPRQCIVCGKLAGWECSECYGDHGAGLDSTAFCETCLTRVHNHMKRRKHKMNQLQVPQEYLAQGYGSNEGHNPRLYMELFAVMCIETSHYVSFVKCGMGPDAPWCFFDSMADRKGEKNGYNIPEVTSAPNVANWLTDEGMKVLNSCKDDKMLPDHAKRLICDGYMCFYQSPQVMMYQ